MFSVRGNFTKMWLESRGIVNSIATGCPSLYMNIFESGSYLGDGDVAVQSTRYEITPSFVQEPSIDRFLFRASQKFDLPMIYQSEPEEIKMIIYPSDAIDLSDASKNFICSLYGFVNFEEGVRTIKQRGKLFFNILEWSKFVRTRPGVIGTRLHGAIIALNSGRKAIFLPHDSRTIEMAEIADIPTLSPARLVGIEKVSEMNEIVFGSNEDQYKINGVKISLCLRDFCMMWASSPICPQCFEA